MPAPEERGPSAEEARKMTKRAANREFGARYSEAKERDMQSLEREIEEKNSRDTGKKRRNFWIKTVLMILLIAGSIAIMFTMTSYLSADGTKSLSETVRGMSPLYTLLFVGTILVYMAFESLKYAYLIRIQTGKWHLRIAVKTMFLGKYYDGITPLGTGGQPFQIYYLHKKKIPAGVATSVPLVRYIVSTIVFCLTAAALFIVTAHLRLLDGVDGTIIMVVASVSLTLTFMIPVVMVFVSIFPRAGKKLIVFVVGILSKLHLVKHRYPTMKKYVYEVEEYRQSLKATFSSFWKIIPFVLLALAEAILYSMMPFFAVLAVAGPNVVESLPRLFLEICCLTMVSFYSASMVPTPGNSVASEAMTTLVFLTVTGIESVLGWVILLWRFANFYVYILSGIGINIFEVIRSAVRNRNLLRRSPAPAEDETGNAEGTAENENGNTEGGAEGEIKNIEGSAESGDEPPREP